MPTPQPIVALRHWTEFERVDAVLGACLDDLGGLKQFIAPGSLVVIKPNITANAPAESGGTTHVELVEALVRRVQRCAPRRLVVAESTGKFGKEHETAFPSGGWREMAARTGVELYNLDTGPHREMPIERARCPQPLPISELILAADTYITVPCLKTHIVTDYTVALKNGYAVLPQPTCIELHKQARVEHSLADLNRARPPDLVVVDGWDGAEGIAGGTHFERPAGARVMLAGADPVAVDVVSREVMCLTAPTRHLTWAMEDGLGEGRLECIRVRGDGLGACRHPFMSPSDEVAMNLPGLELHDLRACSGCRTTALAVLSRLDGQQLSQPLHVIYGHEGELPSLEGLSLAVGDCTACHAGCMAHVAGCPPQESAIIAALCELGLHVSPD